MSLYVNSSALVKRYANEPDADVAEDLLSSDPSLVTGRLTLVEVRRNLVRLLNEANATAARAAFEAVFAALTVVELNEATCERAASIAEITGVRTLDALHLAAAQRAGATAFLTFDLRQAQAGRTLGMTVLGV